MTALHGEVNLTPSKATEGTHAASEEATEKVTVEEGESTVETDYDGFVFGPISNISSKKPESSAKSQKN